MRRYFSFPKILFAALIAASAISFSSFRQKQKGKSHSFRNENFSKDDDTTSRKRNRTGAGRKLDRLDGEMEQLDGEMKQLDGEMENLDRQMKKTDLSDLDKQVNDEIKKIDVDVIIKEVEKSLKDIKWEKVDNELSEEVSEKLRLEMEKTEKALKKIKSADLLNRDNINIDTKKMNNEIRVAMSKAKSSVENAKEEIRKVHDFTNELEKDSLIDKSKRYKIEVKNNDLYINGKKQSKEISDKYRRYYRNGNYTIDMGNGDEFEI